MDQGLSELSQHQSPHPHLGDTRPDSSEVKMPVLVVCFCRYFANRSIPWRSQDFDSYMFVQALKGNKLNGYCHVPVDGDRKRLDNRNLDDAVEWFGIIGSKVVNKKKVTGALSVVPVPSSNCTVSSTVRPPARKLAKALSEKIGNNARVLDCLRWKKNLGSASKQGGPRNAEVL